MFKPKYAIFSNVNIDEKDKKILSDSNYKEFKDSLLKAFQSKIDENIDLIVHSKGKMDDEMRGKLLGVVLVYEDLIDLFTRKEKKEKNVYQDPVRRIEEGVRKMFS